VLFNQNKLICLYYYQGDTTITVYELYNKIWVKQKEDVWRENIKELLITEDGKRWVIRFEDSRFIIIDR